MQGAEKQPTERRGGELLASPWIFWALVLAVAVVSLVFRLSMTGFPTKHPDEAIVARLATRTWDAGIYSVNWDGLTGAWFTRPTYQFSPYSWFQIGIISAVRATIGLDDPSMRDVILIARRTSCVLSALAIVAAAWAAQGFFRDRRVSLLASCILALTLVHVQDSIYARVDTFLNVVVLLCLGASARALAAPNDRRWTWSTALLAGLCVATKYNVAPILLIVPILAWLQTQEGTWPSVALRVAILCALCIAGFVLATPEMIRDPDPLWEGMKYELNHYGLGHPPFQACVLDPWDSNAVYWTRYITQLGIGWGATLLTLGYLALAWSRATRSGLFLAAYVVMGTFVVVWPIVRFERNLALVTGAVVIAAASAGVGLVDRFARRSRTAQGIALAAVVLIIAARPTQTIWRFKNQIRPASRNETLVKRLSKIEGFKKIPAWQPIAENLLSAPQLILVDYGDGFSAAGMKKWAQAYPAVRKVVIETPWSRCGYPHSTIEFYHNAARMHVWYREDPADNKAAAVGQAPR